MACVISAPCPMTTPTENARLYFANALLPAVLPTPPTSEMMPLLATPPCLVLLPTSPPSPNPSSRADAGERWDARKSAAVKAVAAPLSVPPGRADAVERWDEHKAKPALTTSPSSSSSSSNSPTSSPAWSSIQKRNSNKKRAISAAAASSERWDAQHKQQKSSTGSNNYDVEWLRQAFYAGPGFVASPDASMLPMPSSFMLRVA